MVKKLLLFSTLLLITLIPNLNVNAIPLGYPVVWYHENGVAHHLSEVTRDTWGGTEVYVGSNIGRISSGVDITRVDYNWYNANLCSGKTINIKGRLFGLGGLFNYNASLVVYSNGNQMTCTTTIIDQNQMDFNCYSDTGGGDISVYMSTVVNYTENFRTGISRNIDVTCDVTNEAIVSQSITNTQNIINNQNSNTNTITQNQDSNTQNIINNQNQNTQDVIDNQNSNTDKEIESQKVCSFIDKNSITLDNHYISSSSGIISSSNSYGITDYIKIDSTSTLNVVSNIPSTYGGSYLCFYNVNKTVTSCTVLNSLSANVLVTIPPNSVYFRTTINKSLNRPQFELCTNGNQALNDSVNNLNDTLKNDTPPDTENQLNDLDDSLISDTPITDLITLPITLLNSYISGFSGSCSPYNLGNLYGTDLILPCLNLEQRLGSNLWTIIDSLFSIFMIYNLAMLMIQAFEGFTSLRDDYEGLYQPRHADLGYQPKHGGGN